MTDIHEPTPEFLSHLEWQVRSALSRRDRFSTPVRRTPVQVLRVAALILVSVFCGAAGVITAEEIQESRQKEMLLQQAGIRLELARIQYGFMRSQLEETQRLYVEGLVAAEEVEAAQMSLADIETDVVSRELDLEEIRLSGVEPRDELTAPLVGGRDFVTERLSLRLQRVQAHTELMARRLAAEQERMGLGVERESPELEADRQRNAASLEVELIAWQLDLRRRFLAGELEAEEVETQLHLRELETELTGQRERLEHLRQQLARMQRLYEEGLVGSRDVRQVETQLQMREMEMQLVQLQLAYLYGGEGD